MAEHDAPPSDAPLNLDALYADLNAEYASAPAGSPTATDAPAAPTPRGEGDGVSSGATPEAEPDVPPQATPATKSEEAPTPKAAPVKKPDAKDEGDPEARIKKLENDLALARKGQAAEARRANALAQAGQLEAQRIEALKAEGRLTQEEVDKAPLLQRAWVDRVESEAQQAEATAEQQRLAAEAAQARDEREAELEFKSQALSLATEMVGLGLSATDADHEQLLRDTLASDTYAPDVALTWKLAHDPAEAARVYERMMAAAKADVKVELERIAAAKQGTETKRAAVNQFDRSSSPGPSTGGPDIIPDMSLDEGWSRVQWKT